MTHVERPLERRRRRVTIVVFPGPSLRRPRTWWQRLAGWIRYGRPDPRRVAGGREDD